MQTAQDRRRFQRFTLPPMYSRITVRPPDSAEYELEGHAYDISEGGIRFELDEALAPGTQVAVRLDLPHNAVERRSERRSVFAFANIVWKEDDDEPGPVRLAAVFTRFASPEDQDLLRRRLISGRYAAAA